MNTLLASSLKRPAFIAFVIVFLFLIFVVIRIHSYACPWLAQKSQLSVGNYETGWSMALSLEMVANVQSICWSHAEALLSAEKRLAAGQDRTQILRDLDILPGVKASLMDELDGDIYQYPPGAYQIIDLKSQFKGYQEEATGYTHPIMQRKVGGLTRFVKWRSGIDSLDIMVQYIEAPGGQKHAWGLIFDKKWILNQIPAFLDSLAREDPLLLFWSRSTPDLAEQSIGATYGSDTLWWQGKPSLRIISSQPSQLIQGLEFHARHHYIKGWNDINQQLAGIRKWFMLSEIFGIAIIVLSLFAIRPKQTKTK
jgi:hypothetical protein